MNPDSFSEPSKVIVSAISTRYVYRNGVYVPEGEDFLRARCLAFYEENNRASEWSKNAAVQLSERIRIRAGELLETPPSDLLNLANGLLDLETANLRAHTPDHRSTIQIPVRSDPEAECTEWDRFINAVLPDCADLFWEIVGYVLVPDSPAQKILLLYGPGGNGKSTLLRALESLLGRQNVSNITLQDLADDKFASADLYRKLANICGDIPARPIKETGQLKQLTGGDEISAQFKFRDRFKFRNFAKLIFSANELPRFNDSSDGLWDRLLIVPMEARFRGSAAEQPQAELLAVLAQPNELSGALNKALEGRRRLNRNKGFTETDRSRELLNELRGVVDPVEEFLRDNTVSRGEVEAEALRAAFNRWAEENNLPTLDPPQFGKALNRSRPEVQRRRKGPREAQTSVYKAISLVSPGSQGSKAISTSQEIWK